MKKPSVKVKICCISSIKEARLAVEAGAYALGLVGPMPSGPGVISDEQISEIAGQVPKDIRTFLLTSETSPEAIIDHYHRTNTTTIQLVDQLEAGAHRIIRRALPDVELVQVIHVMDDTSLEEALKIAPEVDAILLDSGNPKLETKELGGTGRTHNWEISRRIVKKCPKPVFLAGGLKAENVGLAITQVQPFGLDLCSGVRSENQLDSRKVQSFFEAILEV